MSFLLRLILHFPLYILLQKFLFQALALGEVATPAVHLLYVLFFPITIPGFLAYFIVFLFGLTLDFLSPPIGANAFSCVFLAGLRFIWIGLIAPAFSGDNKRIELEEQPANWLLIYMAPLILAYEIVYVSLSDFAINIISIQKIAFNTLYTTFFCFIFTILFYKRSTKS